MHVTQHNAKAIDKNWNLNQNKCSCQARLKYPTRNNPRETRIFFLSSAPQVSVQPCRTGFREYHREGPYFVLYFLRLPFCLLCGVTKSICLKPVRDIKIKSTRAMERVNFQSSSILNLFITLCESIKSFSIFASVVYKPFYYQGRTNLVTLSRKALLTKAFYQLINTTKPGEVQI